MLLRRVHEIISLLNVPFSHMTLRTVFLSAPGAFFACRARRTGLTDSVYTGS